MIDYEAYIHSTPRMSKREAMRKPKCKVHPQRQSKHYHCMCNDDGSSKIRLHLAKKRGYHLNESY
jgi:hypothetical protein